ncbi:MAG TPA: hypothetical protein V6C88_08140 [Chroococcidiopsis sp.]
MLNIVRCSHIQGLFAIDSATISHLGKVEGVWLDQTGKVTYLSANAGYVPLEQVANIDHNVISTYGRLVVEPPKNLHRLHRPPVRSCDGEVLGWVEDFLFDWYTGEITAYIVTGPIADPWSESVVLYPEDVEVVANDHLLMRDPNPQHLKPASEGLKGLLSERSQQLRHLVRMIGDRLHGLIAAHDQPEVVRVKVKQVGDEIAASGSHDPDILHDAIAYWQEQAENLQYNIRCSNRRAAKALDAAWKHLMGQS